MGYHPRVDFIERMLDEAAARGEFDAGENAGRRISLDDSDPGWWGRREAARIRQQEGAAAVVDEVERSLGKLWLAPSEAEVRERVAELNARLTEAGVDAVALDPDETVAVWRRMARLRLGRGSSAQ